MILFFFKSNSLFSKSKPTVFTYNSVNSTTTTTVTNSANTRVSSKPIILNFDRYKVTESLSTKKKEPAKSKPIVGLPAPRKCQTFNENETPSHKESAKTFVLNSKIVEEDRDELLVDNKNLNKISQNNFILNDEKKTTTPPPATTTAKQQQQAAPSAPDILYFQKPIMRTGSTVNSVILSIT